MKHKKRVLIIVHGAWPLRFRNRFLEMIRSKILGFLTSDRGVIRGDYHSFEKTCRKFYDKVEFLRWDGWIFKNPNLKNAELRLVKLLNKNKDNDVDIITFSLGGLIVQNSLLRSGAVKINRVIFVGAIHKKDILLKNVKKVFNIYSKTDAMFNFANDLYVGFGNIDLLGKNVKNISLTDLSHNDLRRNKLIFFNRKNRVYLYTLYNRLLNS